MAARFVGFSESNIQIFTHLRSRFNSNQPQVLSYPSELQISNLPQQLAFYSKVKANMASIDTMLTSGKRLEKVLLAPNFDSSERAGMKIEKLLRECNRLLSESQTEIREKITCQNFTLQKIVEAAKGHCSVLISRAAIDIRRGEESLANTLKSIKSSSSPFDILTDPNETSSTKLFDDEGGEVLVLEIESSKLVRPELKALKGASQLTKLLEEMSVMCVAQGSIIDRIDEGISRAHQHAKEAEKQLLSAKKELESGFSSKLLRILIVLNVLFFSLLVLKNWKNLNF